MALMKYFLFVFHILGQYHSRKGFTRLFLLPLLEEVRSFPNFHSEVFKGNVSQKVVFESLSVRSACANQVDLDGRKPEAEC